LTLSRNFLVAATQTVQHHSGRNYVANSTGLVSVPLNDALSFHAGQALCWTSAGTSDRPVNVPGQTAWTSPMRDATVGDFIFPKANTSPIVWVKYDGSVV
jgi:hypothetical protein